MIRAAAEPFFEGSRKWFTWLHLKVLTAILRCRTSALGGHVDECSSCGHRAISFNSCRNRHCPKCQANARDRWLEARRRELLPTPYVHVVFTLPGQLAPLALQNKREIYGLLFRASAETLLQVARDPETPGCGDRILQRAAHLESTTAAPSPCPLRRSGRRIGSRSHPVDLRAAGFFLPVKVLSRVFRGKFVAGLRELHADGKLGFHGALAHLQAPQAFAAMAAPAVPLRLGGLFQAPFRRSRTRACAIWAATRIAWRSPITGWSRWQRAASPSAGATRPTRTRSA